MSRPKKIPILQKEILCPKCGSSIKVKDAAHSWTWATCPVCGNLFSIPEPITAELQPVNKYMVVTTDNNTFSIMDDSGSWHRHVPNLNKTTLNNYHTATPFRLFTSVNNATAAVNRLRNSKNARYDWNSKNFYWCEVIVYFDVVSYTGARAKIL